MVSASNSILEPLPFYNTWHYPMGEDSLARNSEEKLRIGDDRWVKYTIHSMLHTATIEMDPTKLELIEGFEKTSRGHQYSPKNSNIKVIISGRDWSEKKFMVYGSKTTGEAARYIEEVVEKIQDIGKSIVVRNGPNISNLAINGDFGSKLNLENIYSDLSESDRNVEYEPEQFPALKFQIEEPSCTFLLFSTGTFVIQGLTRESDINPAIREVTRSIFD